MLKNIFLILLFCFIAVYIFLRKEQNSCRTAFLYKQPKVVNKTTFYEHGAETDLPTGKVSTIPLSFSQEKDNNFSMLLQCQIRDTIQHFFYKEFVEDIFQLKVSWKQRQNDTLSTVEQVNTDKISICNVRKNVLKYKIYCKNYGRYTTQNLERVTVQEFVIELKYFMSGVGYLGNYYITIHNK